MGSYFRGLSKEQWSMEVSRLRTNLNGDIESILKFSYDALCDEDKDLFLHIACFFNKKDIMIVEEFLVERFKDLSQRLYVLEEKSLISIDDSGSEDDYYQYINMHNMLAQLGKEIVRKESVREPGQRQFLIDHKDICEVLTDNTTITGSVIGRDSKYELNITEKAFERMSNLEFLRVKYDVDHQNIENIISSRGPLTFISPKLRVLDWCHFAMTCLPITSNLEFLVKLKMRFSKLEKLWDGIKLLRNLERMDLSYSENLKEIPNLSMATSLTKLDLRGCLSLLGLPHSIANATNLKVLDLSECSSMVELLSSFGKLSNLYELNLKECSSLVELPSSIGNLTNLSRLYLIRCSSLVELSSSIGNLTNLSILDLSEGSSLVKLPSSIESLTNRCRLSLYGCSSLVELPSSTKLYIIYGSLLLDGCSSLVQLPSSIWNIIDLEELYLRECSSLVELPSSVGNLTNLKKLFLKGCSSLVSLPQFPDSLMYLDAENCESLEKLDCSFRNPSIRLNFFNCFKLNKEARDLIIQTSTLRFVVLPGEEVPACFTYRGYGSSVTVKLNQKPLHTSTKFKACILFENDAHGIYWDYTSCVYTKKNKACILLDNKGEHEVGTQERGSVSCRIKAKHNAFTERNPILTEHLYIFEVEVEEVTSTELVFDFEVIFHSSKTSEIKKCGIIHLLEHHHVDGDEEMCKRRSDQL